MKRKFYFFFLILFLSGCATTYRVRVNGYLDTTQTTTPIPPRAAVFVIPNKDAKNPIFENEIKSKIESLLRKNGYKIESYDKAEFFIDFVYYLSPGRVVTEMIPVNHPGEIQTVKKVTSEGKTRISYIEYPSYTTYVPRKFMTYTSFLTLDVFPAEPLRKTNEKKAIWIGEASNTSENPDMREAIDYLLVAVFEHFGEDTRKTIIADISQDDSRLKESQP